ncbi:MAG: lasso RiPP family leader peptide-containing protein [Pseudomonadota bacterium]
MSSEAKKPYVRPALVVYGDVRTLTKSTGSANGDAGQSMMP